MRPRSAKPAAASSAPRPPTARPSGDGKEPVAGTLGVTATVSLALTDAASAALAVAVLVSEPDALALTFTGTVIAGSVVPAATGDVTLAERVQLTEVPPAAPLHVQPDPAGAADRVSPAGSVSLIVTVFCSGPPAALTPGV
ncbi:MAG TPA: hypothetical protein VEY89_12150, partial [Candidatus Dormibacteraeota bacterium]|nr:hypothetical protein [Candidatus Dormibacteraeota bacterium]